MVSLDPGPSVPDPSPAPKPHRQLKDSTVAPFHRGWVVHPENGISDSLVL